MNKDRKKAIELAVYLAIVSLGNDYKKMSCFLYNWI